MSTVPRREVNDRIETLASVLDSHLTTSPRLARVLGVLDAVQDGADLTVVTETLGRLEEPAEPIARFAPDGGAR